MLIEALEFAAKAHEGQKRKNGVPYIVHPVSVAFELLRSGADERLVCAGLLHDTMEDAGVDSAELEELFGREIAELVSKDSEDKALSWETRKQASIDSLKTSSSRDYKMLMCADKLVNLLDIERRLAEHGEAVWSSFKRGRVEQKWLYTELIQALSDLSGTVIYEELKDAAERVFEN